MEETKKHTITKVLKGIEKKFEINKWCWDGLKNEIVLYNENNNGLQELAIVKNFTESDYKKLPQEDNKCLDMIIKKLKGE